MRADLISDFDGTQPYHRQSPPSRCFSTIATLAPSDAPPAATTRPPAPPPITAMSKSGRISDLPFVGCVPCGRPAFRKLGRGLRRLLTQRAGSHAANLYHSARTPLWHRVACFAHAMTQVHRNLVVIAAVAAAGLAWIGWSSRPLDSGERPAATTPAEAPIGALDRPAS